MVLIYFFAFGCVVVRMISCLVLNSFVSIAISFLKLFVKLYCINMVDLLKVYVYLWNFIFSVLTLWLPAHKTPDQRSRSGSMTGIGHFSGFIISTKKGDSQMVFQNENLFFALFNFWRLLCIFTHYVHFLQMYITDKCTFNIDMGYVHFKTFLFSYTVCIPFHNVHYYSSHVVKWNVHYHIPFKQNLSNCEFSLMTRLIDFFQ